MTNHPNRRPIQPPPAGSTAADDRDDECVEALAPALGRLVSQASAAGWVDAEIFTAVLALVVAEMRDKAGDRVTRESLASAIMMLDE